MSNWPNLSCARWATSRPLSSTFPASAGRHCQNCLIVPRLSRAGPPDSCANSVMTGSMSRASRGAAAWPSCRRLILGLARGRVPRGIEPGNRGRATRVGRQAADSPYGALVAQGDREALAERIDALPVERQENVWLPASQTLLNGRRRLVDDRIDLPFHEMSRREFEDIVAFENPAVRVAEGRPVENEVLGHCRGCVRDAVLARQLHSGENRARFSPHEEAVPGEAIGAERLAHESAAARRNDDRARSHGPGHSIAGDAGGADRLRRPRSADAAPGCGPAAGRRASRAADGGSAWNRGRSQGVGGNNDSGRYSTRGPVIGIARSPV